jgi:hypothetical protein
MSWAKSHWKAVLAAVIAFVIGAAAGASGANKQEQLDRKDSRIASMRGDLRDAQSENERANAEIDDLQSYREDAEKYRRHKTRIAREAEAAREAEVTRKREEREQLRAQREAEEQAAQGTIEGDGTWHAGEDFAAGTYRADAGEGCYWSRLRTPHGSDSIDDIIDNGLGGGQQTVLINDGEWFETQDCGVWTKIG